MLSTDAMAYETMTEDDVLDDQANSNFFNPTLAKPRPAFNSLWQNVLPPSNWQAVADAIGGEVDYELTNKASKNTCAIRLSYSLNYGGSPIPSMSYTFTGKDQKNYILGAATMKSYLISSYGTNAANTIHLTSTPGNPLTASYIKSQLNGKKGIYVLIPNDTGPAGFGASGHVDLLNSDGMFASGHSYYYSTGGVKEVYLFILN
jgi:hypothetical protein